MPSQPKRRLELGPLEKTVRWIEETAPDRFVSEIGKKLGKAKGEKYDPFLKSAAIAAARSTRVPPEGGGEIPHGWLLQPSVQSLIAQLETTGTPRDHEAARAAMVADLTLVNREIQTQLGGRARLPDHGAGTGSKDEIFYAFLEEVRAGNPDGADQRFSWLISDLEKGPINDLVISAGLEGVAGEIHKVVAVVEAVALLTWMGWDWAPILLRPVVRMQASGTHAHDEYRRCLEAVESRELLRLARRRPPGQPSLGERDPNGFLACALEWSESDPDARLKLITSALADGVTLEDTGELLGVGATLLFLQETLRALTHRWSVDEARTRMHMLTGVFAMTRLVRHGTPGQRILGLLLAGYLPGVSDKRLAPSAPDSGWWLTPVQRTVDTKGASIAPPAAWAESLAAGKVTGLLPILTATLDAGHSLDLFTEELARLAPLQEMETGYSIKLERALADAYRSTRSPHRWTHLWAAALASSLWPMAGEA